MRNCLSLLVLVGISFPLFGADSPLTVGFGEADISPKITKEKPVFMAGFGHNRKATEINDPLMARAVVLEHEKVKLALVSVDLVGFFRDNVENVRKQLKGFDYVLVSSTHNHEGPDTLGLWGSTPFMSGVDPDYMKFIEDGILKAIKQADEKRKPTRVEIGKTNAPELLHDGREPYIKHDELGVLRFLELEGKKPIGLFVNWHNHPETLADKNTKISADYVATTVKELKEKYQCPVAYFTGTVGGLMTSLKVEVKGPKGELLKDGTFEKTEEYGRLLAKVVDKALKDATPITLTPLVAKSKTFLLPMENKLYQAGWQVGVLRRKAFLWNNDPYTTKLEESTNAEKPMAVLSEVGYLKLGELEIAIIPGEIYPELVLDKIQDPVDPGADFPDAPKEPAIYTQFKSKHKMLIGLGNDEIGYLIPKRQWDAEAPFCYKRTKTQYGEINSIGPEAAGLVCKTFKDLVTSKGK